MATPITKAQKPALEETSSKPAHEHFSFVPPKLDAVSYVKIMQERFGEPIAKEDNLWNGAFGRTFANGKDTYTFWHGGNSWSPESVIITVKRDNSMLATLHIYLASRNKPIGPHGNYTIDVADIRVSDQNCTQKALKTILKNIAPPGLEAVVAED
ncbi:MAG: hypothetical protein HY438_03485 [DPANN group archaeon]|nr:hypothetical protein [DPANN group archaeon]